jgi:hypothetical protein
MDLKGQIIKYEFSKKTMDDLNVRFTYHQPKDDQIPRYQEIRGRAELLALRLCQLCPESRELSLALTKLDEVVFWANAAIARRE